MVFTIGVFGSCATRDLFYSKVIPNYKDYFQITTYSGRQSIISFMQQPLDFEEDEIDTGDRVRTRFIKEEFEKKYFQDLINNPPDYYIMDIYYEVIFGILYIDKDVIITNNYPDLSRTSFYNKIEGDIKTLTLKDNPIEYFKLFKEYLELFFNFFKMHCPNTKIILNRIKAMWVISKPGNTFETNENLKKIASDNNVLFEQLENYIIDNFDVAVIDFSCNYLLDANHMWGIGPMHYEQKYYDDKFNQLKKIVTHDKILRENKFLLKENLKLEKKNKLSVNLVSNMENSQKILSKEFKEIKAQNNRILQKINIIENFIDEKIDESLGYCPFCDEFLPFLDFGQLPRKKVRCPKCNSLERTRLLYLFINIYFKDLIFKNNIKLLHFAPEYSFYKLFNEKNNIDYFPVDISPDIYNERNMPIRKKVNMENIPYEDNTFNVIYNSHVLEHVSDDFKAMSELYRVLKKDGVCITLVPINRNLEKTIENEEYNTPELRLKYFGQEDHVRLYGLDFKERLKNVGFDVEVFNTSDIITSEAEKNLYKLNYGEIEIFVCKK